ncbi:hypothetical protein THIARS_70556 [Thiomonas delicata]|uniref:Uncharacterized protein n=1 Tax=Thiomonas delicata TaxID=364030 RepID=A0A238D6J6_THIDL|nr:hypothetical protein THIARS_70556 [Thiomonas delicata]
MPFQQAGKHLRVSIHFLNLQMVQALRAEWRPAASFALPDSGQMRLPNAERMMPRARPADQAGDGLGRAKRGVRTAATPAALH